MACSKVCIQRNAVGTAVIIFLQDHTKEFGYVKGKKLETSKGAFHVVSCNFLWLNLKILMCNGSCIMHKAV